MTSIEDGGFGDEPDGDRSKRPIGRSCVVVCTRTSQIVALECRQFLQEVRQRGEPGVFDELLLQVEEWSLRLSFVRCL
jgi:hypothetical protein